jgi:hypothetical protein
LLEKGVSDFLNLLEIFREDFFRGVESFARLLVAVDQIRVLFGKLVGGEHFQSRCAGLTRILDMRLNEHISEPEYVSKKHILVNQKAELRGTLEAFEHNRLNRFEPAIQFVLEAKTGTILLSEGNQEQKRDFLKKIGSNFQLAEKTLAVKFKTPWNLLAEFNSDLLNTNARQRDIAQKSNWRREGDSNPRYGF